MTNPYCEQLGIAVPRPESVKGHREANVFTLLIVALLENGGAMTLVEVARRLERAGVAPAEWALRSLQRCRPGRAPVYRDGDRYSLDLHDHDLDLWLFRLGLRPPRVAPLPPARPEPAPEPLPGPDVPLAIAELEEAWRSQNLYAWSRQRLVVAVLDAHRRPLPPHEVVAFVAGLTEWHGLHADSPAFRRRGSVVEVSADGRWSVAAGGDALASARQAVRERIALLRRWDSVRPGPAEVEASLRAAEERRAAHAAQLAELRRVIVHAFPAADPQAVVLLDVGERTLATFVGEEIAAAKARLDAFDVIAAVEVRELLRALGYDPGARRLAELGPPQKTRKLNARGRTLKITTTLLIQGSCGIGRPFGDPDKLRDYLRRGQVPQLRRRLEADAKSLFALYEFGCLHGAVRLRWGFLDERIPAPWVHPDEMRLYSLLRYAAEAGAAIEVVAGAAPGWSEPWSRARRCSVRRESGGYRYWIVEEGGWLVDEAEVQLARLANVAGPEPEAVTST